MSKVSLFSGSIEPKRPNRPRNLDNFNISPVTIFETEEKEKRIRERERETERERENQEIDKKKKESVEGEGIERERERESERTPGLIQFTQNVFFVLFCLFGLL